MLGLKFYCRDCGREIPLGDLDTDKIYSERSITVSDPPDYGDVEFYHVDCMQSICDDLAAAEKRIVDLTEIAERRHELVVSLKERIAELEALEAGKAAKILRLEAEAEKRIADNERAVDRIEADMADPKLTGNEEYVKASNRAIKIIRSETGAKGE